MGVTLVGQSSLPDPGFYNSPSTLPAGLASGSSSGPSTSAAGTAAQPSSYQSAYSNLLQQDTAELLQVSFGSADAAQSNVSNVLAQAAALQQQELAAQQQAQTAAANVPAPSTVSVPTLTSIIQQSNANAYANMSNGTLGASIDNFA
jgi:hypothetical protein